MSTANRNSDIIVIGAGIAGVSAAAELSADARVILLEMEPHPGYHASGRSAAYFAAAYGKKIIRDITGCCESFLRNPPEGFTEVDLFHPRDCLFFGREDQAGKLGEIQADNPDLQFVDAGTVCERVPVMSPDYVYGALWDRKGGDLEVDALLQGFLRQFRRRGGYFFPRHCVSSLDWTGGRWSVTAGGHAFTAPVVVNAAGAWVERVSELAGLGSLGIQPLRRTALMIDPPEGVDTRDWPEMVDADEDFYFKPDAGQIMISPADETPSEPCDAQAEELDVATGIYRFEQATGLEIRHVKHRWAGLRTFAPDRVFVTGFDPRLEGFFWLAGQGGYGVQSSPALARLTRYLITGTEPEGDFRRVMAYRDDLAPDRLLMGSQST
ncbi:MAG: FAD-binding oxidoreductase [Xanthomonadales bacterium]|nr:FAD-binding oxidoreductase [Gammaproteobacteria bacterium]MBT8053928.1 FAD-binding oxidoreductase [Gammaproteobacteria bacterium]NND58269.1 FAD-binding oxidoreductase [Xanthomonadales bacterium]NNK52020.1 FAD-binding oxidoreductase [Xanthomonadales bacterium]